MANHITDDYGRDVVAIGAPGSIMRMGVEFPKLIAEVASYHMQAFSYHISCDDEIVRAIVSAGISSYSEAEAIIINVLTNLDNDFPGDKMERIPALVMNELKNKK